MKITITHVKTKDWSIPVRVVEEEVLQKEEVQKEVQTKRGGTKNALTSQDTCKRL